MINYSWKLTLIKSFYFLIHVDYVEKTSLKHFLES